MGEQAPGHLEFCHQVFRIGAEKCPARLAAIKLAFDHANATAAIIGEVMEADDALC